MFKVGDTIAIDGYVFRLRKITKKDIVLRPIGKVREQEPEQYIPVATGRKEDDSVVDE